MRKFCFSTRIDTNIVVALCLEESRLAFPYADFTALCLKIGTLVRTTVGEAVRKRITVFLSVQRYVIIVRLAFVYAAFAIILSTNLFCIFLAITSHLLATGPQLANFIAVFVDTISVIHARTSALIILAEIEILFCARVHADYLAAVVLVRSLTAVLHTCGAVPGVHVLIWKRCVAGFALELIGRMVRVVVWAAVDITVSVHLRIIISFDP